MFRFFSRTWENFKEYVILVILLIISLLLLPLNQNQGIKQVRAIAFGTFGSVTSIISDVINIAKVKGENTRLRRVNAELMLQVNKLREYGVTNEELKRMLHLRDSLNYPLIPALVVSRSLTTSQGTITINVGSKNSVQPGRPVINDQGLIGVVHSIAEDYAIARTLKNSDLRLTVKDERSRIDGIMKWNGDNLVIIDVPKTYDVESGDRIITSDLSSVVSIPLPVGVVSELSNTQTGIFNEVKIKPFVNFSGVENVFVLGIVQSKQKNNLELNFYKQNK
jgi:rod shape-determining protein MreC